jgi:two-component system chemotaxis response regulator CheB
MTKLNQSGGMTIAESRQTAVVWGMPGALIEQGGATMECPVDMIAGELMASLCL